MGLRIEHVPRLPMHGDVPSGHPLHHPLVTAGTAPADGSTIADAQIADGSSTIGDDT
jgi:hypothetical protein